MVEFAKAIAGNSDLFTAQAFVYQSNNLNLVVILTGEGEDVFTKVRMTAASLETNFFETEEDIPGRLDKCVSLVKEQLKDFSNIEALFSVWHDNVLSEGKTRVLSEGKTSVLYIQNESSHKVFLLREDNLIDLTPDRENLNEGSGQLISGHIQKGDKLLFLTSSLLEYISDIEDKSLKIKSLLKISPDFFDEEINALWRGEEELGKEEETTEDTGQGTAESKTEVAEILHTKKPVAAVLINFPSEENNLKEGFNTSLDTGNFRTKIPALSFFKSILKDKFIFFLVPLLIILLAGGFGYYYLNQQAQDKIQEVNSLKIQAREKYSQSQSLKELDSAAAMVSLKEAQDLVEKALSLSPQDQEAKALMEQIKSGSPEILKTSQVSDWPVFLSLDLLRKDFKTQRFSHSIGKILMLDLTKKTLIMVDLASKNPQVLAGKEQLGEAKYASLNGDFAFVYSEDKGVVRVDTKNQKATVVIEPDEEWGRIQDIYGFGSNIYLLDGLKNQVWKYVPVENGYSDKSEYFKNAQKDLVNAKRLHIDGSIWLLKSGPEILRFTSGVPDNFSVSGLDKNLGQVEVYFVEDTTDSLYVLDKTNSRLVAFEKDGKYVSQTSGDKFNSASDIIVDEENKKAYLLEDNKIYTVNLN